MKQYICSFRRTARHLSLLGCWLLLSFAVADRSHGWQDGAPSARQPASTSQPGAAQDIRPASFKDLTPGQSTLHDVTRRLGPAAGRFDHAGNSTLRYKIKPFSRVEIVIAQDVVTSIVIYLDETSPRETLAEELGLSEFRPAPVPDEHGMPLGQAFPERGVLFGFAPGDPKLNVAQIILEPIGAEAFVYRVLHDAGRRYRDQLADLDQAQKLDPQNARCHWLKARILSEAGRSSEALTSSGEAVRLEPQNLEYQLTEARLISDVDRVEAIARTTAVLKNADSSPVIKAKALCQLGGLSDDRGVDTYLEAIKLAAPLANDERARIRLSAKQVLFEAHLAVAQEIAWGNYRRKREVVQKWLGRADDLAKDLIQQEQQDEFLKLQVARTTLAAYVASGGVTDPTPAADRVVEDGGALFESAADPLFRAQVQWEVATSLLYAGQLEFARRNYQPSIDYAEAGIKLFEFVKNTREPSADQDYVLGRLYFLLGAVHAIDKGDHRVAVKWYDKAEPLLRNPLPLIAKHDLARHADRFVSMGVSYWHGGARNKAVQLSERGAELLEVAVHRGQVDERVLAIPYGNLASMQDQLGRQSEANRYAAKAARVEATAGGTQQR